MDLDEEVQVEDLPSSKLGTKEYWDQIYATELENFNDHGDEGEIWFGKGAERRVIDWINSHRPRSSKVLDLGCGNGHFTLKMLEAGWADHLGALDYSETAVELAKKLTNLSEEIFQADILNSETIPEAHRNTYNIIVDKGTFDAISLNPDFQSDDSKRLCKTEILSSAFKLSLQELFASDEQEKVFIITSCNWTADELKVIFAPECIPVTEIPHTKFIFGGKSGQDVSTVVFLFNNKNKL